MKLCTFRRADGTIGHGRLNEAGDAITDLGDGDLSEIVSGEESAADTDGHGSTFGASDVQLLPPLLRPGKVLASATNYQDHIIEGGGVPVDPTRTSPKLFSKPLTALAGDGDAFPLPEISHQVDWEVELAVVIGRRARNITADAALAHVFGYATSNDISLRSLDIGYERDMGGNVGFFDWLEGKWADGSAPVGPWLVTADEVGDPQALRLRLEVNGTVRQDSATSEMIFSVAELVAFASRLCTLLPGDILLTGTPAGVGATTSTYLAAGDVVVAEVVGLGRLTTPVVRG